MELALSANKKKYKILILPPLAILYFGISILVVFLALSCLDRVLLPILERRGDIGSASWKEHNDRVNNIMGQRNWANKDNPIWRSTCFPVGEGAHQKRRILVMGDSYVWGDGQANMNDIWWRQLQIELEHRGYNDVEVIAAGRCGYSTSMELKWAKKLVQMYKPDAIIFGYITNDPDEGSEVPGDGFVKQLKGPPDDSTFNNALSGFNKIFPNLAYQLKSLRGKNLSEKVSSPSGYSYFIWEKKLLEGKNFEAYTKTVHKLGDFVANCGIPAMVVSLPMPFVQFKDNYAPVEKLFRESGVPFTNLMGPMLDWYNANKKNGNNIVVAVNPVNGHPGLEANKFYARETANLLEKQYASVLGPKGAPEVDSTKLLKINDFVPPIIALSNPKPNIFALYYPKDDNLFLLMPFDRPYIQLNLTHPYAVKEIHVVGKSLTAAKLAVRSVDPSGKKEAALHDLDGKKGGACIFKLPEEGWAREIDEVLISADLQKEKEDKQILVEFVLR